MIKQEVKITFATRKLGNVIVIRMSEGTFVMNAQKIIMAFQLVNLVVATRKEARMMLVTLIVEIVIVCQMLLEEHVPNVNVIISDLLQIVKVHTYLSL